MLFGAHCNGGIKGAVDRAAEIGADAVQLFAQSPRTWHFPVHAEEDLARFRERRAEAGIENVLVHALYLCNLATPDEAIYGKSIETMRSTMDAACAIEADGVVFHVGSHLGTGFEAGLARCVPALAQVLDRCSERDLAPARELRRSGRHDRAARSTSWRRSSMRSTVIRGSASASTHAISTSPASTSAIRRRGHQVLADLDSRIGLDRLRALHVNDAAAPLGSNRDRHANVLEGELGERLGAFLAHPAVQKLPAVMETPGPAGHGPDAAEVQKLRDLHKRWTKKKRR